MLHLIGLWVGWHFFCLFLEGLRKKENTHTTGHERFSEILNYRETIAPRSAVLSNLIFLTTHLIEAKSRVSPVGLRRCAGLFLQLHGTFSIVRAFVRFTLA